MEKHYNEIKYSMYDKSLYLQRLLFAIESNFRQGNIDEHAENTKNILTKDAEKSIDDAICSLTDILEIIGYFPTVREISSNKGEIWRQPTRLVKK